MKRLLLSTAILGALAVPALAQDQFRMEMDPAEIRASDFMGMRVYATEAAVDADEYEGVQEGWEDIGEVNDVILSRDGMVQAVLVDIGGFLGMGERQVAINMDQLRFVSDSATADEADDFFLVLNASRAALEGAPEYSAGDDVAAAADATGEAIEEGGEAAAAAGAAAGAAVADAGAEVADEAADAGEEVAEEADQIDMTDTQEDAAEAADTAQDAAEEQAEAATEGEMAADATAEAAAGDAAATEDAMAAEGQADAMAADDGAMAAEGRMPIEREGFALATPEQMTADRLQGAAAFDSNDERVGEVGEILLDDGGQVTQLVIDVGGFLGIGEKPVALDLGSIDILQQEGGEEIRVYLPQTREELDAMERYEANQ